MTAVLSGIVERANTDPAKKYGAKFSWYRTPHTAANICLLLFFLSRLVWLLISGDLYLLTTPETKIIRMGDSEPKTTQERKLRGGVFKSSGNEKSVMIFVPPA